MKILNDVLNVGICIALFVAATWFALAGGGWVRDPTHWLTMFTLSLSAWTAAGYRVDARIREYEKEHGL